MKSPQILFLAQTVSVVGSMTNNVHKPLRLRNILYESQSRDQNIEVNKPPTSIRLCTMTHSFSDELRDALAQNLAAFSVAKIDAPDLGQAAVALTIVPNPTEPGGVPDPTGTAGASMLLTRRTSRLNKHAGQWALPGGRIDPGETPLQAALREMDEEVNLRLGETHLLGRLDDFQTRSGFIIKPFVFWADDLSTLAPNPAEVASIHYWPLDFFEEDNAIQFIDQDHTEMPLLRLNMGDTRMHAPTAAILLQLWEVGVHGRSTRVRDYAQPDWTK